MFLFRYLLSISRRVLLSIRLNIYQVILLVVVFKSQSHRQFQFAVWADFTLKDRRTKKKLCQINTHKMSSAFQTKTIFRSLKILSLIAFAFCFGFQILDAFDKFRTKKTTIATRSEQDAVVLNLSYLCYPINLEPMS